MMAILDGIASISPHSGSLLAFSSGGHIVDLRSRYSVLEFRIDWASSSVEIIVFGEGAVSAIRFVGVSRLYSPESGADNSSAFEAEGAMRPDTFSYDPTAAVESAPQWFAFETDSAVSLAIEARRATYGPPTTRHDPRSMVRALNRIAGRPPRIEWRESALQSADFDLVNRVVRLVTRTHADLVSLEFQNVLGWSLSTRNGVDARALIADAEHRGAVARFELLKQRTDDGHLSRHLVLETAGAVEINVRATVVNEGSWPAADA